MTNKYFNTPHTLFVLLVSFALLLNSPASFGITVDDLISNNKLVINVSVATQGELIAKQGVTLEVELLTDRWFSSGNNITKPDFANAVVIPSATAINGTKKINGATWVSQIRELVIYPMDAGLYEIPALTIFVAVDTAEYGVVSGNIASDKISFNVVKPQALNTISDYVVSSSFAINIDGNFSEKTPYKIGEAVTLTYEFTADDTPGMMIPELSVPTLKGVSVYHKPATLNDSNVRGQLVGKKTETISFIFEKSGSYSLPEQVFYWWNSEKNSLETIVLDAKHWQVSGEKISNSSNLNNLSKFGFNNQYIKFTLYLLIGIVLILVMKRYRHDITSLYKKLSQKELKQRKTNFLTAIEEKSFQLACQHLYTLLNLYNEQQVKITDNQPQNLSASLVEFFTPYPEQLTLLQQLLGCAYSKDKKDFNTTQANLLIKNLSIKSKSHISQQTNSLVELNPK